MRQRGRGPVGGGLGGETNTPTFPVNSNHLFSTRRSNPSSSSLSSSLSSWCPLWMLPTLLFLFVFCLVGCLISLQPIMVAGPSAAMLATELLAFLPVQAALAQAVVIPRINKYVVLVTISNGNETHVRVGKSTESAADALQSTLHSIHPDYLSDVKIDVITKVFPYEPDGLVKQQPCPVMQCQQQPCPAVVVNGTNHTMAKNATPPSPFHGRMLYRTPVAVGWFYGLATDWTKDHSVFLPAQLWATGALGLQGHSGRVRICDSGTGDSNNAKHMEFLLVDKLFSRMQKNEGFVPPSLQPEMKRGELQQEMKGSEQLHAAIRRMTTRPPVIIDCFHTKTVVLNLFEHTAVPLIHGNGVFPVLTPELLENAAKLAGDYFVSNVQPDGSMTYDMTYLWEPYSLNRHAGTMYAMAALYRWTRDSSLLGAIERALDGFIEHCVCRECPYLVGLPEEHPRDIKGRCVAVASPNHTWSTSLGVNALTLVAITELLRSGNTTVNRKYMPVAEAMAHWIMHAQNRSTGKFVEAAVVQPHVLLNDEAHFQHYVGEAYFAMIKFYRATGLYDFMERASTAVRGTMEREKHERPFFFDFWTLHGITELWEVYRPTYFRREYYHFAQRHSDYMMHALSHPSLYLDRVGRLELDTAGIVHRQSVCAVATKSEGICAMYDLARARYPAWGHDIRRILDQTIRYQLQAEYVPGDLAAYMKHPHRYLGTFPTDLKLVDTRNDYTPHSLSALLCMWRLLENEQREKQANEEKTPSPSVAWKRGVS